MEHRKRAGQPFRNVRACERRMGKVRLGRDLLLIMGKQGSGDVHG